jgi:hypothetical protein
MFSGMKDSMADELRTHRTDNRLAGLLDSAQAHLLANEADQAIAIWDQMIAAGGEEGDWGHLKYANYLLECDQGEAANRHLVELMVGRRVEGEPWRLAAELFEERGELDLALLWYTAGVGHLPQNVDEESRAAQRLRVGRRRLRWAMGVPLDEDDLDAKIGVRESHDKWFDLLTWMGAPEVVDGRLHFWKRDDIEYALRLWPAQIAATNPDEYYQKIEGVLRAHDGSRVLVAPRGIRAWIVSVEATNHVGSMGDLRPVASRLHEGRTSEWPPQYDQACWCESGTAYVDCCGASGMLVSAMTG